MKSPRFCPNPHCQNHQTPRSKSWFWKAGHYHTRTFGSVQRFFCRSCSHRFSAQSFSIDYYAKRKVSYQYIDRQLRSTGSIRDLSRDLKVTTGTVANRISRLARNALAVHAALEPHAPQHEDLVADGFESFCVSQYFPNNITLLAGKESQYLYAADYCTIRRKGRMTERQKSVREELERRWKADPKGIYRSFSAILTHVQDTTRLFTDEKHEYVRSIRRSGKAKMIHHVRVSSKRARTVSNPLFSVNYLDREIRKDCANHVRETVCFARNVSNCMERLWVYFVYHNYRKVYRIGTGEVRTHGEMAGITPSLIRRVFRGYYSRRVFLSRVRLPQLLLSVWLRMFETPLRAPDHVSRYAAA